MRLSRTLTFVALAALITLSGADSFASAMTCQSIFQKTNQNFKKVLRERRKNMFLRDADDSAPIERRIKILVSGLRKHAVDSIDPADVRIDFADPSLVMPITYPNGVTKYRINASGLRYIEADQPNDFYRGGVFKVQRSRGFYADGTEMRGAYHNEAWSWDVVTYKNDKGQTIALGGTMAQPEPGALPNVANHNSSRSRWYGTVEHVETSPGTFEERIIWQAPVHDFNRTPHTDWNYHGYGGTLLTKWNAKSKLHEPVKLQNGNHLLFYERVTEQKTRADGTKLPHVTTMFSREMDPSLTTTVGKEYLATDIKSKVTGKYFKATKRGKADENDGYLAEGGNVFVTQSGEYLKTFSANDYVRQYGIYLDYLPKGSDPRKTFKPVVDDKGELIDFAAKLNLREIMHGTWVGRPQLERDPQGKLWMKFHFVPIESIPKGAPVEGWPTAEDFVKYGRITAMAPVKIVTDSKGQPNLELDIDQPFKHLYE